ncbi:uncharacterized protein [Rutidosis leptorrhynchoides]|uniref:uncharacterized protein n=1 Tax=Rutidosis leptorrhynchoides TaxID=125765 RepID=UPI003A999F59
MPKMDRNKWMYEIPRHSHEYLTEFSEFMKVADEDRVKKHKKKVSCPCKKCQNFKTYEDLRTISQHLIVNGFVDEYICWSWHGELLVDNHSVRYEGNVDGTNANTDSRDDGYHDNLEDMLHDLEHNIDKNDFDKLQQSFTDSEKPLYAGCTKFTKLSAVLRLVNLKANNNWSDKSFKSLLELLHDMLPEDNELPVSYYQAKKVMCLMGLEVQRIHACPNDCILYRNVYKDLHECPVCGVSRLKRLFGSAKDAKLLRWNVEERKKDGKLRHVADSSQWRNIDNVYTEFGQEGPKPPGNDIDVYLAPLIDDLKTLWNPGVAVYDAYKKETFNLRSMIFCTISDFPAYGNLSGYSTKGSKACPLFEDNTSSRWLKKSRKMVFTGHRKSLERHHPYRIKKDLFDGTIENGRARSPLDGETTFSRVENVNVVFGKTNKSREKGIWKKRSIFWRLPYWKYLQVRHCIDVMHIEKNVCDSLIGLLLNIQGKTKDGVNVRYDMAEMNIRKELHPVEIEGKRPYLPVACYTLSKAKKTKFCQSLYGVKVPKRSISIKYITWKKVPTDDKDQLWRAIKNYWRIKEDTNKKEVIKLCNTSWKRFKGKLRKNYMLKGREPFEKYNFIEEDTWADFVLRENMVDKQQLREKS